MKYGRQWLPRLMMITAALSQQAAEGAIINVTTNDSYSKIESANPGDEVVIAPGTYGFRLYFTRKASVTNPIILRAQDPANPPVWDFGATLIENAPGSYTAGDRGRGGWQFSGAHNYHVSGIVIRNARTASHNSAAIRYYYGTTNLVLKDCVFELNDNGLTGGTQNSQATVEFCEFNANGNTQASAPTHNIYVYGGYLTLRYCYVHDPVQGQNFHIRCRESTLEYNWFARANSYEGDLMTDDDFSGSGPFTQTMTLRGNVIVQKLNPNNNSQVIAIYNDGRQPDLTLNVRALYNTFVGNGGNAAFVHVSNADGTRMGAELSDNIISGTGRPMLVEDTDSGTVTGTNNWLRTSATVGPLIGSVQSVSPGFVNSGAQDYRLATNSVCIDAASTAVIGLPGREYWLNEATNRQWRIRAAARDIGAFESTSTGKPFGPHSTEPRPRVSLTPSGTNGTLSWPLFAQEYRLEQSVIETPLNWMAAPGNCETSGAAVSLNVPLNPVDHLFRLKK